MSTHYTPQYKEIDTGNIEVQRRFLENMFHKNDFELIDIDLLIAELANPNSAIRDVSALILENLSKERYKIVAAEKLIPLIVDSKIELRTLAGDILLRLKSSQQLLTILHHPDPDVRKFSSDLLGLIGDSSVAEEITKLLDDEDLNVVSSAIETLGLLRNADAVDTFIRMYEQNIEDIQASIIDSLGKIGGEKAENFLTELYRNQDDIFTKVNILEALSVAGRSESSCIFILDELSSTQDEILAKELLKSLFAISFRNEIAIEFPKKLRPISYLAMKDDEEDVRIAGLLSLGNEYTEDDLEVLAEYLNKAGFDGRSIALSNVFELQNPENIFQLFYSFFNNYSATISALEFISELNRFWDMADVFSRKSCLSAILIASLEDKNTDAAYIIDSIIDLDTENCLEVFKDILLDRTDLVSELVVAMQSSINESFIEDLKTFTEDTDIDESSKSAILGL